jgi:hypothetical protein
VNNAGEYGAMVTVMVVLNDPCAILSGSCDGCETMIQGS